MIYAELKTWSNDHKERKTFYVQAFDAALKPESKHHSRYGAATRFPYRLYFGNRFKPVSGFVAKGKVWHE